jgi:hypothetical protein
MYKVRRAVLLTCLLTFMLIGTISNFLPQVEASPLALSDFTEDITSYLPVAPHSVATISNGTIFMGDYRGNIYQSDDGGYNWNCIFNDINTSLNRVEEFFTDSNDNVYFWVFGNGRTWKWNYQTGSIYNVSAVHSMSWHWGEQSNGSIYFNVYTGHGQLWRSDDSGESFSNIANFSALFDYCWHTHGVRVDPYTDDVYWFSGDVGDEVQIKRYDNGTDIWVNESQGRSFTGQYGAIDLWITDMTFDADYIYLGADTGKAKVQRIERGRNFTQYAQSVLRSDEWTGGTHFVKYMEVVDGIIVVNTNDGAYWASWDGEHWYALWDNIASGSARNWGLYKTVDGAIIVADHATDEIKKFFVDASILQKLFYNDFTTTDGDLLAIEETIRNGTNYLDISEYGVRDANITLIGQAHENIAKNGTFEHADGDGKEFAGWKVSDKRWANIHANTTYASNGTTSLKYVTGSSYQNVYAPAFVGAWSGNNPTPIWLNIESPVYIMSFYVRSNLTYSDTGCIRYYYRNATDESYGTTAFATTNTSWTQSMIFLFFPSWATEYRIGLQNNKKPVEMFYDNVQLEYYPSNVYDSGGMSRQYLTWRKFTWTETQIETIDPIINIGDESFWYSGTLLNGTSSSTWSIDITSGIIQIDSLLYGSGMVKVHIEGEIVFRITNAVIRNRISSGLYNATYYGTPTVTTTTVLVIMADRNSSITQASLSSNTLTFNVSGYSGLSSKTKVYCGDRGEPTAVYTVNGNVTWGYNASITMLTLNIAHESSTRTLIYWKLPGDIDGDGDVDWFDFGDFALAFGNSVGNSNYNVQCDFDLDGDVDWFDFGIFAENYGRTA